MPIHNCSRCSNTFYMYDIDVGCSLKGSTASTIAQWDHFHTDIIQDFSKLSQPNGPEGRQSAQINRRPAEHCCGQIWRGVVSDLILIPTLFLHILENCHVAPVDCDMVLHRNSIVICWARWFLQIICGYFSMYWKIFVLELMVLGFKSSLGILPNWKNFQRINHNSFVDYQIIKEVSPLLITPE